MSENHKYIDVNNYQSKRGRELAAQSNLSQMASDASGWVADNASNRIVSGTARVVQAITGLDSIGRTTSALGNEFKNLFNPED